VAGLVGCISFCVPQFFFRATPQIFQNSAALPVAFLAREGLGGCLAVVERPSGRFFGLFSRLSGR